MKRFLIVLLCLAFCGGALAETQTINDYLTAQGYIVVETAAGSDSDVNPYTFCGLAFSPKTKAHGFFWSDKTGAMYSARNPGEAFANAISPALVHLGVIKTFVDLCRDYGFDLGVYFSDTSGICFGLSVDSDALRNMAAGLADGHASKIIVGWDDFEQYLTWFG